MNDPAFSFTVICPLFKIITYLGDHTVEGRALITKAFLSCAESTKILGCFRCDIGTELKGDSPNVFTTYFHVKVNCGWRKRQRFHETGFKSTL